MNMRSVRTAVRSDSLSIWISAQLDSLTLYLLNWIVYTKRSIVEVKSSIKDSIILNLFTTMSYCHPSIRNRSSRNYFLMTGQITFKNKYVICPSFNHQLRIYANSLPASSHPPLIPTPLPHKSSYTYPPTFDPF